jgi:ferredoxin
MNLREREVCYGVHQRIRVQARAPDRLPEHVMGIFQDGCFDTEEQEFAGDLPVRPPGALPEFMFRDLCTACGDCVAVCPVQALVFDSAHMPALDTAALCLSCGLCADICSHGALHFTDQTSAGLEKILTKERRSSKVSV